MTFQLRRLQNAVSYFRQIYISLYEEGGIRNESYIKHFNYNVSHGNYWIGVDIFVVWFAFIRITGQNKEAN